MARIMSSDQVSCCINGFKFLLLMHSALYTVLTFNDTSLHTAGCRYTSNGGRRCISGVMNFEEVDFDRYDIDDVKAIILHEMGA